jgi:hypothetical protein
MTLGIISIVISIIFGVYFFLIDTVSAIQQTVQYLILVCASIFMVSGFILIQLYMIHHEKNTGNGESGNTWKCPFCDKKNPETSTVCKKCGKRKISSN